MEVANGDVPADTDSHAAVARNHSGVDHAPDARGTNDVAECEDTFYQPPPLPDRASDEER